MPRAVVAQATAENRRLLAAAGRSVLLVTDDIALERVCSNVLLHAGCHVSVTRHSGHALLACLSGTCPDLLIAELSMPDGSGPALAERLRRHYPRMHTLYLASPGTWCEAGNVLVRPFSREELERRVDAALTSSPAF